MLKQVQHDTDTGLDSKIKAIVEIQLSAIINALKILRLKIFVRNGPLAGLSRKRLHYGFS